MQEAQISQARIGENTGLFSFLDFLTTVWRWHTVLQAIDKG